MTNRGRELAHTLGAEYWETSSLTGIHTKQGIMINLYISPGLNVRPFFFRAAAIGFDRVLLADVQKAEVKKAAIGTDELSSCQAAE